MSPSPSMPMGERLRSRATRQGLPMLLAWLLALGAGLVALAIALPPGINWLSAILGAATLLSGLGLTLHAALRQPDSLRSTTESEILRPLPRGEPVADQAAPAGAPHPDRAPAPGNLS